MMIEEKKPMECVTTPHKILIIDDEQMVRLNLVDYLEDEGYLVTSVSSGEEALALLQEQQYNTVIVDMRLPGMDGNSFILKAHQLQPQLEYVIHTGSTTYSIPQELRILGITPEDILFKPLQDMHIIVEKILLLEERRKSRDGERTSKSLVYR